MKTNPIYRQEMRTSARSFKFPLVILIFNCVLALAALLDMYSLITQVKQTAEIQYTSFLDLYQFVASMEFILILLITPALTAGSISGERERQTLDLMMTTRLTPGQLILGKLFSSFSTVLLLMVSSFPVLSLVFIYGGVTVGDVLRLLLSYGLAAWLSGCIGVFCSCMFERSTIATVAAYCMMGLLTIGTLLFYRLEQIFAAVSTGGGPVKWFLLFNPACSFERMLLGQVGEDGGGILMRFFRSSGDAEVLGEYWMLGSVFAQLFLAAVLLWLAVRKMQIHKVGKKRRAVQK